LNSKVLKILTPTVGFFALLIVMFFAGALFMKYVGLASIPTSTLIATALVVIVIILISTFLAGLVTGKRR